ncbi:hypothetical protein [Synechococcus sp. PCC 7336]|uniref:hypothetical protein n=1 Tax=Synechococcus sp. PCC 7336 TaxID=195250 RepID=UPI000347C2E6|nr:hypothetical protein [Synechococcus sp. PCC 7336]
MKALRNIATQILTFFQNTWKGIGRVFGPPHYDDEAPEVGVHPLKDDIYKEKKRGRHNR